MFTPRLTPSQSPTLKNDVATPSLLAAVHLTILRQIMNDCGISGRFQQSPIEVFLCFSEKFLLCKHLEVRLKAVGLILDILQANRASPLLFNSLTTSHHGITLARAITAGFLQAVQVKESILIRKYVHTLALLASETGRSEILDASILSRLSQGQNEIIQGTVYGLVRTILFADDYCAIAETALSFILEHPNSRRLGREMLMHALLEDCDLSSSLYEFLWSRVPLGNLMAEFIIFRILYGHQHHHSFTSVDKILDLTNMLKADFTNTGKYPNVYLHLCILHTILNDEKTLEALSHSKSPRLIPTGWFAPKPIPEPDFEYVISALLDVLIVNLKSQRDLYLHSVISAILTNIFVDKGKRCTSILRLYQDRLRECSIILPGNVQIEIHGLVDLWTSCSTTNGSKSPSSRPAEKIFLKEDGSSAAFFLPLIHTTLFQLLLSAAKNVAQ